MKVQAIYTCRLCGAAIRLGDILDGPEESVRSYMGPAVRGSSARLPQYIPHSCPGGVGIGAATFSGFRAVDGEKADTEPQAEGGAGTRAGSRSTRRGRAEKR